MNSADNSIIRHRQPNILHFLTCLARARPITSFLNEKYF